MIGDLAEEGEAGIAEKLAPAAEAIAADVRGIAELFDVLEPVVEGFVFGAVIIDDGDAAAGAGDARHFADGGRVVGKMMRGKADGDDVESGIGEGEGFGRAATGDDVGESTSGGVFRGLGKHSLREVVGDDLAHVGSKSESGVTGTGGDVENGVGGTGIDKSHEGAKGILIAVAGAGGVGGGGGAKLRLGRSVDRFADRFSIHTGE